MGDSSSSTGEATKALTKKEKLVRWLRWYMKFLMASPTHQDRILKLLQYTAGFISSVVLAKHGAKATTPMQNTLNKFYENVLWTRYVTRLLEWPLGLEAVLTGSWKVSLEPLATAATRDIVASSKTLDFRNSLLRNLSHITSYSIMFYYPMEYISYVMWALPGVDIKLAPQRAETGAWWSRTSIKCYVAYLFAEITQCWVQLRHMEDDEDDSEEGRKVKDKKKRHLQMQIARDVMMILPGFNWSLPADTKGTLWRNPKLLSTLLCAEAVLTMYQTVENLKK